MFVCFVGQPDVRSIIAEYRDKCRTTPKIFFKPAAAASAVELLASKKAGAKPAFALVCEIRLPP